MPFPIVSQRNKQPGKNGTVRFDAIARRRACSTLARVARVSRLIGNSDSTVKPYLWQVCVSGGSAFGNRRRKAALMQETPPHMGVALQCSCTGHWPPAKWRVAAVSTTPSAGFPVGFSLLRAARWRLLFPGTRCCSGSMDFSQRPVHHWRLCISNRWSVQNMMYFQLFTSTKVRHCLDSGSPDAEIIPKYVDAPIHRLEIAQKIIADIRGNNGFHAQPPGFGELVFCTSGRARQCVGIRNVQVERSRAHHLRQRSRRPRNHPVGSRDQELSTMLAEAGRVRLPSACWCAFVVGCPLETGSHPHRCCPLRPAAFDSATRL